MFERISAAYNISKQTVISINTQLKTVQTKESVGTDPVEEDRCLTNREENNEDVHLPLRKLKYEHQVRLQMGQHKTEK